jgi:dTMP kinase
MDNRKGKFITLEGPEGAGKSTQASRLAEYLRSKGLEVVKTREPGGVSISEQLRSILLNPDSTIYSRAELMLYAAGRAQHTQELIVPALESGKYVVCERYIHASMAYQGYGRGLDMGLIRELNDIATGGLAPDIVFLFDIDVAEGLQRVKSSDRELDRLEQENLLFHQKVRDGYLEICRASDNMFLLDSSKDSDSIYSEILSVLEKEKIL